MTLNPVYEYHSNLKFTMLRSREMQRFAIFFFVSTEMEEIHALKEKKTVEADEYARQLDELMRMVETRNRFGNYVFNTTKIQKKISGCTKNMC